jgi:hypothetical protein
LADIRKEALSDVTDFERGLCEIGPEMSNVPPSKPAVPRKDVPRKDVPRKKGRLTNQPETALDIAARYFVYRLYDATDGQRMRWQVLYGMGESAGAIVRAVERGWVMLQDTADRPLERRAALTEEGRRLARTM